MNATDQPLSKYNRLNKMMGGFLECYAMRYGQFCSSSMSLVYPCLSCLLVLIHFSLLNCTIFSPCIVAVSFEHYRICFHDWIAPLSSSIKNETENCCVDFYSWLWSWKMCRVNLRKISTLTTRTEESLKTLKVGCVLFSNVKSLLLTVYIYIYRICGIYYIYNI